VRSLNVTVILTRSPFFFFPSHSWQMCRANSGRFFLFSFPRRRPHWFSYSPPPFLSKAGELITIVSFPSFRRTQYPTPIGQSHCLSAMFFFFSSFGATRAFFFFFFPSQNYKRMSIAIRLLFPPVFWLTAKQISLPPCSP